MQQLLSDIDLISYNAKIYNGENHDISLNAKELCELIRVKLKQSMFTKSDTLMQQQMAVAGKLTVPSRTRSALQQKSALDEMKHSLNEANATNLMSSGPSMADNAAPAQIRQTSGGTIQIDTTGPANGQQMTRQTRNSGAAVHEQTPNARVHIEEEKKGQGPVICIDMKGG